MSTRKLPKYIEVDGFRLPGGFYPPAFRDTVNYKCREDDVFLVTYPKCGTTWMHIITYLILHDGELPKSSLELVANTPFPEAMGIESVEMMPRPGVIKSHLPFHLTPYSPKARYIIVMRNPKDCCVSFYHHTENGVAMYDFEGGDFNDYFDLFINGKVDFGDYFDHVLSWYEHRNDPNVLMVTYEEMKADLASVVLKTAKFLGSDYSRRLETDKTVLDKVLANSNMKVMKEFSEKFHEEMMATPPDPTLLTPAVRHMFAQQAAVKSKRQLNPMDIFRKGIVGDWRNVFAPDQNRRMNEKMEERLKGTELLTYWKQISAV